MCRWIDAYTVLLTNNEKASACGSVMKVCIGIRKPAIPRVGANLLAIIRTKVHNSLLITPEYSKLQQVYAENLWRVSAPSRRTYLQKHSSEQQSIGCNMFNSALRCVYEKTQRFDCSDDSPDLD